MKNKFKYYKIPRILRGFTLIELLVVISIIALLLSILMPALNKVKEQARTVVCKSNARSIGLACITFALQNDDWLPMLQGDTLRRTDYERMFPHRYKWYQEIAPFMDYSSNHEYDNFFLVEARTAAKNGYSAPKSLTCPSVHRSEIKVKISGQVIQLQDNKVRLLSYGWNWMTGGYGITSSGRFPKTFQPRKLSKIINPSVAGLLGENRWDAAESRPWAWGGEIPATPGSWPYVKEYYYGKRHNEGGVYICPDGHVEFAKYEDLVNDWKKSKRISEILPKR